MVTRVAKAASDDMPDGSTSNIIGSLDDRGWGVRREHRSEGSVLRGFEGNADIAGIGITAAYLIEAILVTFYLIVFAVASYLGKDERCRQRGVPPTLFDRILNACRGSLNDFRMTAAILSGTISVAAFLTFRTEPETPGEDSGNQVPRACALDGMYASLVTVFSVFPVFCLSLLAPPGRRRKWLRRSWNLVLFSVVIIVCTWRLAADTHSFGQASGCPGLLWALLAYFIVQVWTIVGFLGLVTGILLVDIAVGLARRRWRGRRSASSRHLLPNKHPDADQDLWGQLWSPDCRPLLALFCFCCMWSHLALFLWFRNETSFGLREHDVQTKWSFGQILALGTWAPLFVEWTYSFCFGLKEGLDGRMPIEYESIRVADLDRYETNYRRQDHDAAEGLL